MRNRKPPLSHNPREERERNICIITRQPEKGGQEEATKNNILSISRKWATAYLQGGRALTKLAETPQIGDRIFPRLETVLEGGSG